MSNFEIIQNENESVERVGRGSDTLQREIVFHAIHKTLEKQITIDELKNFKTKNGNTQKSERDYINIIREILNDMGLTFTEAATQQSKDFRIKINKNLILHMECKKTDKFKICFNDTCPNKDIFYIIIFTGKEYKRNKSIKPQIIGINGNYFIEESQWIEEYRKKIEYLRDYYGRGENAKNLSGPLSVFPRGNYFGKIRELLK